MTSTEPLSRKIINPQKKYMTIKSKKETGHTGGSNTKPKFLFDMGKLLSGTIGTTTPGKLDEETSESDDDEDEEEEEDLPAQSQPLPPKKPMTISRLLALLAETPLSTEKCDTANKNDNPHITPFPQDPDQGLSNTTAISRPNSQTVRKVEFSTESQMNVIRSSTRKSPLETAGKSKGGSNKKGESTRSTESPPRGRISKNVQSPPRLPSFRSRSGSLLNEIREMSLESQDALEAKKKNKTYIEVDSYRKRRKRRKRKEDDYTDLTRAAALTQGSRDLKQSLKAKKKRDRKMHVEIDLLTKEEFFSAMLVVEATFHMRVKKQTDIALKTLNKALKLQPSHKAALVARSQCHLNLGDAASALKDAETTFDSDELYLYIQGLFHFAEALYQLGQFEKALIAYHQGNRLRKDMQGFRLGIQKSQEAIKRAIGSRSATHIGNLDDILPVINKMEATNESVLNSNYKNDGKSTKSNARARWVGREALGQMYSDKDYLMKFLERPGIKNNGCSNAVRDSAKEALNYLEIREQFWRQQNPLYSRKTNIPLRLTKNSQQNSKPSKMKQLDSIWNTK